MVDSVSSSTSTGSTSSASSTSLSASYDMFLQLLITQIQTQSPLDPVDATDFTSQLAQYAGLEQQISTNDKLDEVLSAIDTAALSSGVGYLGKTIEADTDTLSISEDGSTAATWKYSLASAAAEVTLTVVDSDGNTVWTGAGETGAGAHSLAWDGKDSDGNTVEAGAYTLQVEAASSAGAAITSSISISGAVTAVDSSSGSTVLELGDTQVDLSVVTRLAA